MNLELCGDPNCSLCGEANMNTADVNALIEVDALDDAYNAGVEACLDLLETFQEDIDPDVYAEMVEEFKDLQ